MTSKEQEELVKAATRKVIYDAAARKAMIELIKPLDESARGGVEAVGPLEAAAKRRSAPRRR